MGEAYSRCSDCEEYEEGKGSKGKGVDQQKTGEETGLKMKTMDCDWMIAANQEAHRTDEYENESLVLRRGDKFKIRAKFQRKLNREFDEVFLEFHTGPNPQLINNTKIRCKLADQVPANDWGMTLAGEEEVEATSEKTGEDGKVEEVTTTSHVCTFEVSIPAQAVVGKYKSFIEFRTKLEDGSFSKSRDFEPDLYILFNPWCPDDAVYLESEEERKEYCLNDHGIIYRGSTRRIHPKRWNFGQFEKGILDCVLSLLDKDKRMSQKPNKWMGKRADPVWVSRVVPYMINDIVLAGNWSGDYTGGVSPTTWNGSVKILKQHYETGRQVNYGQCWVFSGVVTTALRALGIPTRSITNFASAHDTEGSMTIDKYVDEDGDEVELSGDSVWNFHVWNEAWMKRADLPSGYDGWQIVDATPQEVSLGLYQTGPAPLTAIKNGEVFLGFETGFVFAEVNADRVTWIVTQDRNDGNYVVSKMGAQYKRSVGRFISTKAVGEDRRHDVTEDYKFAEGSAEEREAFSKALSFGSKLDYHKGFLTLKDEDSKEISITFDETPETFNGEAVKSNVNILNGREESVTCTVTAVLYATSYTGERSKFIKRIRYTDVTIAPGETVTQPFEAAFKDYHGKLSEQQGMRLTVAVKDVATRSVFVDDHELEVENRDMVTVPGAEEEKWRVGEKTTVTVRITNPLPVRMNGIEVTIEGAGLSFPVTKSVSGSLEPGASLDQEFELEPAKSGQRMLLVDVDSRQIKDLKASAMIKVQRR